jgi:hypothetical protein
MGGDDGAVLFSSRPLFLSCFCCSLCFIHMPSLHTHTHLSSFCPTGYTSSELKRGKFDHLPPFTEIPSGLWRQMKGVLGLQDHTSTWEWRHEVAQAKSISSSYLPSLVHNTIGNMYLIPLQAPQAIVDAVLSAASSAAGDAAGSRQAGTSTGSGSGAGSGSGSGSGTDRGGGGLVARGRIVQRPVGMPPLAWPHDFRK